MKTIYYVVGAFGAGKTTLASELVKYGVYLILEDEAMLQYLSAGDPEINTYFYPSVQFYKLMDFMYSPHKICVCDSHPYSSCLYSLCFSKLGMYGGSASYSMKTIQWYGALRRIFQDSFEFEEKFIYINLPLEKHVELIEKRWKDRRMSFPYEKNLEYLKEMRKQFDDFIQTLRYCNEIIEITDLDQEVHL